MVTLFIPLFLSQPPSLTYQMDCGLQLQNLPGISPLLTTSTTAALGQAILTAQQSWWDNLLRNLPVATLAAHSQFSTQQAE